MRGNDVVEHHVEREGDSVHATGSRAQWLTNKDSWNWEI
jgi:hypothetical protein